MNKWYPYPAAPPQTSPMIAFQTLCIEVTILATERQRSRKERWHASGFAQRT